MSWRYFSIWFLLLLEVFSNISVSYKLSFLIQLLYKQEFTFCKRIFLWMAYNLSIKFLFYYMGQDFSSGFFLCVFVLVWNKSALVSEFLSRNSLEKETKAHSSQRGIGLCPSQSGFYIKPTIITFVYFSFPNFVQILLLGFFYNDFEKPM